MNILIIAHMYVPYHNSGGETYLHQVAKDLVWKGHNVRVYFMDTKRYMVLPYSIHEGVDIFMRKHDDIHISWCHVIISHLGYAPTAYEWALQYKKPFIFIAHNDSFADYERIYLSKYPVGIIYNSKWVKKSVESNMESSKPSSVVFTPPVNPMYAFRVKRTKPRFVSMINMNENKGGLVFTDIVKAMPDIAFMGVTGSYYEQFYPEADNFYLHENTPDLTDVYMDTKILLMPSEYESWGMVAREAMHFGIPVICTRTPGLEENCGEAAMYIEDRNNTEAWVKAIRKMMEPKTYKKYSTLALNRVSDDDPTEGFYQIEKLIYEQVQQVNDKLQQPNRL